jgi:hypothetical protein
MPAQAQLMQKPASEIAIPDALLVPAFYAAGFRLFTLTWGIAG